MNTQQPIRIERTASYRANEARAGMFTPCVRCGRGIKGSASLVHMNVDWQAVPVNQEIPEKEDTGWFLIGPECAKTIPASHRQDEA